jgi:hypothetical protein
MTGWTTGVAFLARWSSAPTAALVLLASCNAHSTTTNVVGPGQAARSEPEWIAMSWEDRHDVMTFAVLPNMGHLFQRFRGAPAPDMTCRTCHGQDAERVAYKMPHGLPPLDPSHMPDANSHDATEAKMAKFMTEEVTPAMADLLGETRSAPGQKQGFSCFNCHPSR